VSISHEVGYSAKIPGMNFKARLKVLYQAYDYVKNSMHFYLLCF
jgi:hypothetical protein